MLLHRFYNFLFSLHLSHDHVIAAATVAGCRGRELRWHTRYGAFG